MVWWNCTTGENILTKSVIVIDMITNGIPYLRRILPFINKPRLIAGKEFPCVCLRQLKISLPLLGISHINNTLCELFACGCFPTPFRPLKENGTDTCQLAPHNIVNYSVKIHFHCKYYTKTYHLHQ